MTFTETGYSPSGIASWCDNDWLAIATREPGSVSTKSLFLFNANNPNEVQQMDLTNLGSRGDKNLSIGGLECTGKRVVFTSSPETTAETLREGDRRTSIYSVELGKQPELIAAFKDGAGRLWGRGPFIHPKTNHIAANGWHMEARRAGQLDQNCATFLRPGYQALCWDAFADVLFLEQFALQRYQWEPQLQISRGQNIQYIPNPNKPLLIGPDGKPIVHAYLLYDFDHRLIREVKLKTDQLHISPSGLAPDPIGQYLYAPCYKVGDHDPKFTADGRVCRQKMDAQEQPWEVVFSIQERENEGIQINRLDISARGDVVFTVVASNGKQGIWKYDAESKKLLQITKGNGDSQPVISPDGRKVVFERRGRLTIAHLKGSDK